MKDINTSPIKLKGPLAWMAKNSVAANILMFFLLIGGFLTSYSIKQEVFPAFEIDVVRVSVAYPGASPKEIEDGILLSVEESIRGLDNVKDITATANEGSASISVEFNDGVDLSIALADVKNAVDSINNFPEDAEKPNVSLIRPRREVLNMVVYGQMDDYSKYELGKKIRDELLQVDNITSVELSGLKSLQIAVEIPKETLEKYNLSISTVSSIIRNSANDLSSGSVSSDDGEIMLRLKEQRRKGSSFEDIPVLTTDEGSVITLGQIAKITDGFEESDIEGYYKGLPSFQVDVSREGDQTPIQVSDAVHEYINSIKNDLPEGVSVEIQRDRADDYRDRLNLLLKNAMIGLALVIVLLGLFLDLKLAFWVTMGIPISFLGTLLFMPSLDVSINMMSLFAFIMALGMVVDDAIVVGESIYTFRTKGYNILTAAILGAREVVVPVTFAIITNVIAFLPLLFMGGVMGRIAANIPIVVITAFLISLVEALVILPAHLGHSKHSRTGLFGLISKQQNKISTLLEKLIYKIYKPILRFSLKNRYSVIALSVAMLVVVLGYVMSGKVRLTFSPETESDDVTCSITLPYGAPLAETTKVQDKVVKEAQKIIDQLGGDEVYKGIYTSVGSSGGHFGGKRSTNVAEVQIYFKQIDVRGFELSEFVKVWRKNVGEIAGVETMSFGARTMGPGGGSAIHLKLTHNDSSIAEAAAKELAAELAAIESVKDVDDGLVLGKPQLDIKLTEKGYALNLTPAMVGSQLRASFYGSEALRFQRGRDEVKVNVMLPESERESEQTMDEFLITSPSGALIPLKEAVKIDNGYAYTSIERVNGRRVINVTADCEPKSLSSQISSDVMDVDGPADKLKKKYPGLSFVVGGMEQERQESMSSLMVGFILAFIATFGLLAVVFRSYIQPVIILVAIPFGIIGAVIGHIIMGFNLSLMSFMGIVALSGIVINDSLVLVDFANRRKKENCDTFEAVTDAGTQRFRPVILTTLTTFLGLTPMIFETSMQAKMLIPMAISLGFGELFSTMIILLLVPSLYLVTDDVVKIYKIISLHKHRNEECDPNSTEILPSRSQQHIDTQKI